MESELEIMEDCLVLQVFVSERHVKFGYELCFDRQDGNILMSVEKGPQQLGAAPGQAQQKDELLVLVSAHLHVNSRYNW